MRMRSIPVMMTVVLLVSSCHRSESKKETVRTVRAITVHDDRSAQQRTFGGLAKAGVESRLSFRIAGSLDAIPVKVGDVVKAGEVIAQLDPHDFELQVEEAEASLLRAQAQEHQAVAQYNRISDLYETESSSRSELDAARAQAVSGKAASDAIQKKLELARLQLSYASLRAPQNGEIATVDVEVNENVAAGQPVIRLHSGDTIDVVVSIPEKLISRVHEGDVVNVRFDAKPNVIFPAAVTEVSISRQIAPAYPVTVQLLRQAPDIRSGMSAEVQFNFADDVAKASIVIPPIAVFEQQGQEYVYVVTGASSDVGQVQRRAVRVHGLNNEGVRIAEGLQDGDVVVTAGSRFLTEGQKVHLRM